MKNVKFVDHWPLIIEDFPAAYSYEELDEHFTTIDGYLGRKEGFAIVIKLAVAKKPGPDIRRYAGEKYKAQMEQRRRYLRAEAVVTPSKVIKGIVSAIYWYASASHPRKVFTDFDSAVEWARSKLDP